MRNFYLTAAGILAALFISCTRESDVGSSGAGVSLTLDYSGGGPGTRSSFGDESVESRVSNVLVLLYRHSDGMLDKTYFLKSAGASFNVVSGCRYDIFFLANIESPDCIDVPSRVSEMESLEYRIGSFARVAELGIPSCSSLTDVSFSENGKVTLNLVRLFARINLRIIGAGISGGESGIFSNKALRVCQANVRMLPFAAGGSLAVSGKDVSNDADYEPLMTDTGDDSFVLYVPENRQGTLLPGNSDPSRKSEEFLKSSGRNASLPTYLEFKARLNPAAAGFGGDLVYRFYPGADNVSDFDIERNGVYDITLNFSTDDLFNPYWKVSHGDEWSDGRVLKLLSRDGEVLEDGAVIAVRPGFPAGFRLFMGISGKPANRFTKDGCSPYSTESSSGAANNIRWTSNVISSDAGSLALPGIMSSEGLELALSDDGLLSVSVRDASRLKNGKEYEVEVMLVPAREKHRKTVKVKVLPEMKVDWDADPGAFFLAQRRTLEIGGFSGSRIDVSESSSGKVLKVLRNTAPDTGAGISLDLSAISPGSTSLRITTDSPLLDPALEIDLDVLLPVPRLSSGDAPVLKKSVSLSYDGTAEAMGFGYYASASDRASLLPYSSFDPQLYDSLLRPVASHTRKRGPSKVESFICADISRDSIYVSCLSSAGEDLWTCRKDAGVWDEVSLRPSGVQLFQGMEFPLIEVSCLDPFPEYDGKARNLGEFHIDATPSSSSAVAPFEFSSQLCINASRSSISVNYDGSTIPEVSFVSAGGNRYDMNCRFDYCSPQCRKGCDAGVKTLSVDVLNFRSGQKVSCLFSMTNYVKAMICTVLDVYWYMNPAGDPEKSISFSLIRMIWYDSWKRLKAMGPEDRLWTEEADYGVAGCVYDYGCFYREVMFDYTEGRSWAYMGEVYSWVSSRLDHSSKHREDWNWTADCLKFFRNNEFPMTFKENDNPYLTIVTLPLDSEYHGWLGAYVEDFPLGYDYYDIE